MRTHYACLLGLLSLAQVSTAAEPARDADTLYQQLCANCHGAALEGGRAPDLRDQQWRSDSSDAALARVILEGIDNTGMPGFSQSLSAAEAQSLVIHLRELLKGDEDPIVERSDALPRDIQRSELHAYRIEKLVDDLDVPWSLAFLPDGRMLFTERTGQLFVLEKTGSTPAEIPGIPAVWDRDEGGLMTVAVHPDYARNGWIYLTLSDPGPGDTGMTQVVRGRIKNGRWAETEAVFTAAKTAYTAETVNFGGGLVFDGDYLFISIGERGATGEAQDLRLPNGKIHRLFHDGSIPPDNPFVDTPGALPSIWAYGNRNPQGLARNPIEGTLWSTEHGPRGGDELNQIRKGRNYGWPIITHGMNYDGTPVSALTEKEGLEQPVLHWTPSIAVSPIRFHVAGAFPRWHGHLFLGSLARQQLIRMEISEGRVVNQEQIFSGLGRVRDIVTGPDGLIYLALEPPGDPSYIVRLVPADPATPQSSSARTRR